MLSSHHSPRETWGGAHEFELLTSFPGFAAGGPQTILGVARSRIQVRDRLEEKHTPKGGGGGEAQVQTEKKGVEKL